jgi:hypothetical protein
VPHRQAPHAAHRIFGRWSIALLGATTALLLGACSGGETDVKVHFAAFACTPVLPAMKSLSVRVGERIQRSGVETLAQLGNPECQVRTAPMTAPGIAAVFGERGYVVKDVPADKETRLVILPHVDAGCAQTVPVCLMSDPIVPGGTAQDVVLRGTCAPLSGPGDILWQLCISILGTP